MTKKKIIFYLLLLILIPAKYTFNNNNNTSAITYNLTGRLGDNIITYIKTKWISYKHQIPLLFKPFKYSNELMINKIEKEFDDDTTKKYNKKFELEKKGKPIVDSIYGYKSLDLSKFNNIKKESKTLYISNYNAHVEIDWSDKNFIQEIKKCISPLKPIEKPKIPKNCISVAVHVRKGGGFDLPLLSENILDKVNSNKKDYADYRWPLKFPPDQYYIDQIKKLCNIFDKNPLHIHIFTDDKNPQRIVAKYKNELNIENITFSYREKNNSHNSNVIEDLFAMTYYDCLIRSLSNFAICADILGNFSVVIYPEHGFWEKNSLIIDKVKIRTNLDKI